MSPNAPAPAVPPTATGPAVGQALLLEEYLRRLRLPVVLSRYPQVAKEAAQHALPYEQFLLLLAEQEVAQRDENMQRRRIAQAKFPVVKTLDQFDFSLVPQLNRQLVLELAQGHYLAAKENVLLVGQVGTGKTHIATALAVAACRQGFRVRFFTAAGLMNELLEAQAAHRLGRFESTLLRFHLLVLDEVGFVPFSKAVRPVPICSLASCLPSTSRPASSSPRTWNLRTGPRSSATSASRRPCWTGSPSTPTSCRSLGRATAYARASDGKNRPAGPPRHEWV